MAFNIVLVEPEIPQNTGNIVRTCACTGATLHLVGPLGFSISDKHLKRAGLDYWDDMDIRLYDSFEEVVGKSNGGTFYFCTTKAKRTYKEVEYKDGDYLVFGKETKGLPESILQANYEWCIRIPMLKDYRSLNLSNSVAIVLYEAVSQLGFPGMLMQGELTGRGD
ncbi:MAG TPA: tRNA (uridine(34)/cytosine(34)/5-carboxymethylaminomethyluridine(34)-2'-O)-methyltransferase TrmL [Clostridia bacterium]|jgi:tRNA (cytidine/uridine-2'-O-)-methyltransferase|nr:tRNA (uridine(34)/cytosine(34)/5-carboxymethylaminomethyluridine(34)-2'-O)-methyltransferase TrmL [Clostridiaceae bacterium]HOA31387.1 tRNA (uridine(34)/cytosine(34)/5-carboxymethylaminomethyluridine(34)-2'-O)-methyltransferase TrmL [Clostridia bacterium]HPZ53272.1 tRNA (uridine(34)/cytosine(34)/5-carboxymethylaminomethyluridine(34)-2'-O)-methyltransferase TrmL [Clostridia bacterium]